MATESAKCRHLVPENLVSEAEARRDFLKKAGRFAAVTPPAITLLLGTSLTSKAIAKSGGLPPVNSGGSTSSNGGGGNHFHPRPRVQGFKSGGGRSGGDNYGGGSHGGSRGGDPN
ncbi:MULTISPECIES: hypothetical protein [unclassified Mesorhizobium]|uniref:hypothetical protein n=1 Tax=unclassified Mesorhizobium TaxID=325217 RepID=UPI000FCABB9A|nr:MULTISPECIES: hypothetical protein [unclassified Mesorhizobium]TGP26448.1 hypothetical protein EN874_001880 [Mesorhizobium sp. M1D.F.Ca.ET.231.01.1.1]TGP38406.1 hypothetical protein EN877_01880 [Mesorhizobium sp. M1D.F.Ca.ET.234.01.1.1]TGS50616.1 hypothetical protein EN827_01880 [Mesorhizobium sp. M1D.F.Ca.ET.184.01.1.1]TGS66501.1 hypothetical protein EN826_001880 [Mesorhizobium sp. M1D.F.Ca.ET.183.01.1.1]